MSRVKAAKAISFLWAGSLLGAGFAFITQVLIARSLGVEAFGVFSSVLVLVSLLLPLAGFGLPHFWLKVFGSEGWGGARWLRGSMVFAVLSSAIVCLLIALWAFLGSHDESMRNLMLMLMFFVIGQVSVDLVSSKFQLEERFLELAAWQTFPACMRFLVILFVLYFLGEDVRLYGVGASYALVGLGMFAVGVFHLYKLFRMDFNLVGHGDKSDKFAGDSRGVKDVMKGSFPFGVAGAFHLIYFQGSIILLAYLVGTEEAGIYNVAFVVMSAVYIFPNTIYQKFLLPKIHRWSSQDPGLFYRSFKVGSIAMLGFGGLACVSVWLLAPYLIMTLFGPGFDSAIEVLRWLCICAPLRFMATSVGSVLVTQEHIREKIKCMGLVAFVSVALSLVLIPAFSISGALIVAILSEMLLLVMYCYVAVNRVFNVELNKR